jgi:hypothetical protein
MREFVGGVDRNIFFPVALKLKSEKCEMPGYPVQAIRVLAYGADEILLDTRAMLLALLDFETDMVRSAGQFHELLRQNETRYRLAVLCHTVPPRERPAIEKALKERNISAYQIEALVAPVAFLIKACTLLSGR